jgi:predicted RNA-binding protein with TRAM domain
MDRDRSRNERSFGRRDDREPRGDRGMSIKSNYFLPKPVKVGDVVDVTIDAVASKGDGIAKKDGFVIFVKDAKQGDKVNVRITEVRARYAVGEITTGAPSASDSPQSDNPDSEELESEKEEEF